MTITNWLFGTCGRSHIGIYVCSRCGYELLRSDFERSFVLKSANLQSLLPIPVTVAEARDANGESGSLTATERREGIRTGTDKPNTILSRTPFNSEMLLDFTKNVNLMRTFHKNSIVKRLLGMEEQNKLGLNGGNCYKIACGKCGSSLGHQSSDGSHSNRFHMYTGKIDLTFRTT